MNKICAIILFSCFIPISVFAETTIRNKEIERGVADFWSNVTRINTPRKSTLEYYLSTVSSRFENQGTSFRFNNQKIKLAYFLEDYKKSVLKEDYITHEFKRSGEIKKDQRGDGLYTIRGILYRKYLHSKDDFKVEPVDVELLVSYDNTAPIDSRVKILEISMNQFVNKVYPKYYDEYDLVVTPSKTFVGYNAEKATITVVSRKRRVKEYPGMGDKTFGPYESVDVKASAGSVKLRKIGDSSYDISFNYNYSSSPKEHCVLFEQQAYGLGLTKEVCIFQYNKENAFKNMIQFDRSDNDQIWDMSVHYSPKYNVGLSVMFTPEESRFSFGGIIASNFDSFRGIDLGDEVSTWTSVSTSTTTTIGPDWETSDVVNGYRKVSEKLNPEENDFSSIFDPYNEAKHYQSRTLIMANCGFHITNWLNISLGVGPIIYRDIYYMESLYDVTRTSYIPTQSGLPAIDDVYTYNRHSGSDKYYFKNPTKWGLGLRPAINLTIPISDEISLPIGCGYVISTLDDCNSLDFSIGISFKYY